MGIDIAQVGAGAVAGAVASDLYQKGKTQAAEATGTPTVQHGPVELEMLTEIAANIERAIIKAEQNVHTPYWQEVPLFAQVQTSNMLPYRYKRHGYKHVSIASVAAFTAVVLFPIGPINFAIGVGLSAFDFPEDVDIWTSAAGTGPNGATMVMLHWGDDALDIPGV